LLPILWKTDFKERKLDPAQSQNSVSDEKIISRVLDGDKESYGILIERYQHLAYRLALQIMGDYDMADDAVQQTFVTAYENLERLKNHGSFASWIAGITKNVCRNLLRDRQKPLVALDYLAEIGIEPSDSGNSSTYGNEMIGAIRNFIPRLPEKYREIIELRYNEDYSCQKIADFLNLSRSAVLSRLFYARKRLLKMLRKEGWK
jgi:RNA polymerase sigma-70 factor (ECF subfamily)